MLLPYPDTGGKHLFLGLVLVGCSPGGTASNLVTLIAGADVALSVLLTTCSTLLASAVTPLLTKLIVGSAVPVSGKALCIACAKVVLAPVALGVLLNEYMPRLCKWVSVMNGCSFWIYCWSELKCKLAIQVSRWTPFASVLLVALICGGVVANTAVSMGSFPVRLLLSVVLVSLNCI
jgi:BASS family bile acid:Na+ symporter